MKNFLSSWPRMARFGMTLLLCGWLAACNPPVDIHGHFPAETSTSQIQDGESRREDVIRLLGTPTAQARFAEDNWYYIGRRSQHVAFFKPEIIEQEVYVVRFDDNGTVRETQRLTLADGMLVDPSGDKTPTAGRELTFIEQLTGNIGRFTDEAQPPSPSN